MLKPSDTPSLVLFNYDWDIAGFARHLLPGTWVHAGFDLFSFPSNAALVGFDLDRMASKLARKYPKAQAVLSNNEQFGALAAALLAQKLGLPGTPPSAVVACQHKLVARQILQEVAPECNVHFALLTSEYGADVPQELPPNLHYPVFAKPVKAAFSVLARSVRSRAELQAHTRFGWRELWVIKRLVEPFERVAKRLLPDAPSAHRLILEEPGHGAQFNLDGYVFAGQAHKVGVVDAIMYPGTQAFMRFDYPSKLAGSVQERAMDVASRFLARVGFTHGLFNMEFFYDAAADKITVIEFNPRMASQMADLYLRVEGLDLYAYALALAHGQDPALTPRSAPTAGSAASFVYRCFEPGNEPEALPQWRIDKLHQLFPDALFFPMPKAGHSLDRDYAWLGSHRYGILHLGGRDDFDLRQRCEQASRALGWPAPYADAQRTHHHAQPAGMVPNFS